HEIVFPLESGNRNPAIKCHSHARANLATVPPLASAPGGVPKCCVNEAEVTPVGLLSFVSSGGLGGCTPNNSSTLSLHPFGQMLPVTALPSIRSPNSTATSWSVIDISPLGRWNVCVSGLHWSTRAVKAALFIPGMPSLTSHANGRNPARFRYGAYLSSHHRGL